MERYERFFEQKKYKIRLSHKAYRAAERESFSEIPELMQRADDFLDLWSKNEKEGLSKEEYFRFKKNQGYYLRRELENKQVSL